MAANVRAAPADPTDRVVALDLLRHLTGMQLTVMSLPCEGLRVSKIAEHLGLPPSTISSHANKARNIRRRKDNDHG
jgi:DNA-binding NarL/FixJ family response regulator